ncbi:hypothetical protein IEQ34_019448 [Dendrobium chrysotoxum]|uniref:Uncharacterized protein n=1 Tax=Dendrobium chrysotoxum TaxID=161865 RepID=A0AAV7G8V0_DENCH|nr:hypothetical protein IEQ34_019448 [Dendrobium chrysotoxum]
MSKFYHSSNYIGFFFPSISSKSSHNYFCSAEISLQEYHGYFNIEKQVMCSKDGQEEPLNGLGHNLFLQCPYHSYSMNLFAEKFQPN